MKPKPKPKPQPKQPQPRAGKATEPGKTAAKKPPYILLLGIILVVTTFVFFPMLKNEFTSWDDKDYVVANPAIRSLDASHLKVMFTEPIANNYHPLTMLSLAMNYSSGKLKPEGYYLWNLLLHLANIVLVFFFIKKLSRNNVHVALFSALLFAVHPMHVESVAWISERKDVLYVLFFVAGLITWLKYLEKGKPLDYAATFLLALCSMFSKPAAIIFPLAMLVIEWYRNAKVDLKNLFNKIPFFILAAFFMYMTWIAQKTNSANIADFQTFNVFERFLFACYGLVIYLFNYLFPIHLAAFHPYPDKVTALYYVMPLVVAAIAVLSYRFKARRNLLQFGFLFYGVNLILVLQFVSIGAALYSERYTYMAYTGLFFVTGMWLFEKQSNISKAWIATLAISAVFVFLSVERVKVWHNSLTLWTDQIKKYPDSPRGYYDRGIYYADNGNYELALADYTRSIKNKPEYKNLSNRGALYVTMKEYDKAYADYTKAYAMDSNKIEALVGLSQVHLARQEFEPALKYVTRSLEIKPSYEAHFTRAVVLKALGRFDEAVKEYEETLRMNNDVSARHNLANIYLVNLKKYSLAAREYGLIADLQPGYPRIFTYKGLALYQAGQYKEAIAALNAALTIDRVDAQAYGYRSMAYHKMGDTMNSQKDAATAADLGFVFDNGAFN